MDLGGKLTKLEKSDFCHCVTAYELKHYLNLSSQFQYTGMWE